VWITYNNPTPLGMLMFLVGSVLGFIIVVGIVAFIVFFLKQKHQHNNNAIEMQPPRLTMESLTLSNTANQLKTINDIEIFEVTVKLIVIIPI
jgi:hypothetical protein